MRTKIPLVLFLLSVVGATFAAGYLVKRESLFPSSVIETGIDQLKSVRHAFVPDHLFRAVYEHEGARIHSRDKMANGLTLITTYWEDADWRNEIRLVAADGKIVHRWPIQIGSYFNKINFDYVHGARLLDNGEIVFNVEYAGLVRMDACGNVIWTSDRATHHSVHQASDDTFWVPGVRRIETQEVARQYPGVNPPARVDMVFHFDSDGKLIRSIDLREVLYSDSVLPYILKNPPDEGLGTHLNDVEILSDDLAGDFPMFQPGDIMLSFRNASLVIVVDQESLNVKWVHSNALVFQHDPDFLPGGWIGIYNNNSSELTARGRAIGGSEIVAVQPHTGETRRVFPKDKAHRFYSKAGGKWQTLSNGNILTIEPRTGRVFEVTSEGELVWEWINDRYGDSWLAGERWVPEVLQATRYDITASDVKEWTCRGS